ncbi:helix-turn-helix domain-containing protein [Arsenophonus apicola]|uniref:Helix-turn-helix transcriptional regulator n=1 Tax=Arsenophonus apicola TaxID=2879119 RepID=A0ABY8P161_9GAMM|nr:helix-turn-helix transcriptional regulator [Arsenophonus apicola]WGO82674.1 helix-turn-helix transcriptional regulator [Arsenophonus apicola]
MKTWREQAGLTSAEMAAKMGVTTPAISKLERNTDRASLERIIKYANACGLKEIRINVI